MAFVTGSASSFADLLAALQNACTANGWTLSGNVLHKGTCFAQVTSVAQDFPCLKVLGGSGQTSGVLTGASDIQGAQLGVVADGGDATIPPGAVPFAYPCTYDIHIHALPDEVYLVVNYGVSFYQFLGFGQSSAAGLTGTGNWYAATDAQSDRSVSRVDRRYIGGYMQSDALNGGLFMPLDGYADSSANGAVDHQLDAATWLLEGAWRDWYTPYSRQPNQWNSESILLPVRAYAPRPDGFVSIVAELAHARFVSLGALADQQVITLGSDKWKVYPWWARGAEYDAAGDHGTYTGLAGHAFRYDGT